MGSGNSGCVEIKNMAKNPSSETQFAVYPIRLFLRAWGWIFNNQPRSEFVIGIPLLIILSSVIPLSILYPHSWIPVFLFFLWLIPFSFLVLTHEGHKDRLEKYVDSKEKNKL